MVRICLVLFSFAILASATVRAQSTTRVSLTSANGEANSFSEHASLSANGRRMAFMSLADNLSAGDSNNQFDVFVRDLDSGVTTLVSEGLLGAPGDGPSGYPTISADGNWVAFESLASNLVTGDTNTKRDVFVRQTPAVGPFGSIERVSVNSNGAQSDDVATFWTTPAISMDGRYVAFESSAPNLVPIDANNLPDVYLRDRTLGTTVRISEAVQLPPTMPPDPPAPYIESNSSSGRPAITPDGRYIVFHSAASNLFVPSDDTNGYNDVYLRDTLLATTTLVSRNTGGTLGNGSSAAPAISADGTLVAFESTATNLVTGDTNLVSDIFVRNRTTSTTARVSVAFGNVQGNNISTGAAISGDGRHVAFRSLATNLVLFDTNESPDVFVFDRQTSVTRLVSVDSANLKGNDYAVWPSLSFNGRFIAFYSLASNLVPNDTNQSSDVFMRDQALASAFTPYCFGDGTGTTCPCNISGGPGRGCSNSLPGATGAVLIAGGIPSISTDTVLLIAVDVTGPGLFFQGTAATNAGAGAPLGDGLLCAGGTIVRLAVVFPAGSDATYPNITTPTPVHIAGGIAAPGVYTYQFWYRDAIVYCTLATFNLTPGLSTIWVP